MIRAYFAQRFPPAVFVPVIGLLAGAAWASTADRSWWTLARAIGLTALLVVQFRLWDDIEDRDADRLAHPERIVTQGPVRAFHLLLGLLHVATLAIVARSRATLAALLVLDVATGLAYRLLRQHISDATWRYGVLPAKYAAFVAVVVLTLGPSSPALVATSAFTVYVGACAYEIWTERLSRVGASA